MALTSEQKDKYDKFSTSLGLIDQNYRTEGRNSKAYQRFLDSITTNDNVGGSGKAPAKEGDGYLVSNGKAYKGEYVRNQTTGDMQVEMLIPRDFMDFFSNTSKNQILDLYKMVTELK